MKRVVETSNDRTGGNVSKDGSEQRFCEHDPTYNESESL